MKLFKHIFYLTKIFGIALFTKAFADSDSEIADDLMNDFGIPKKTEAEIKAEKDAAEEASKKALEKINDTKKATADENHKIGETEMTTAEAGEFVKKMKDDEKAEYKGEQLTKAQLAEKLAIKLESTTSTDGTSTETKEKMFVKIGGEQVEYNELLSKTKEHFSQFGIDFDKQEPDKQDQLIEDYTKIAHSGAWNKAYTQRDQKLANDKRDFTKEVTDFNKLAADTKQKNLEEKQSLEKIANMTDDDIKEIEDEIKRTEAINARDKAKSDIKEIDRMIADNEEIAKKVIVSIDRDRMRAEIQSMSVELLNTYPELRTSEDVNVINKKLNNTETAKEVSEDDRKKVYILKKVLHEAVTTSNDPHMIYKISYKDKLTGTTTQSSTKDTTSSQNGSTTAKDFSKLSLKQQLNEIREVQKKLAGSPNSQSTDKNKSTETQIPQGKFVTAEERNQKLSNIGF